MELAVRDLGGEDATIVAGASARDAKKVHARFTMVRQRECRVLRRIGYFDVPYRRGCSGWQERFGNPASDSTQRNESGRADHNRARHDALTQRPWYRQ